MKRWKALVLLGTLCLGLLLPWQAAAQEEPAGQLAEESGAAGVTEQLDWDVQSVLEQLGLSVTAPDETGEKFTLSHIWQVFSDYLSGRISQPFAMLGGLLTVILFAALLQGIQDDPKRRAVGQVYEFVCALAAVAVLAEPLCQSFAAVESALSQGASFMTLFVPVFAGILAAGGTVTSAVSYQTAVVALADGVMQMITRVLLPFCTMGFSLAIVDAVSPSVSVGGLLRLSRKFTTWVLGLLMTLFLGVLSMQNWLGGSLDTAASKTTKYVIANFVPVVGNAVSDAYTTVRSSLQILRSTTGVIGIVSLCVLFLPPLVQLLLYRAVVAVGAAAAELFRTKSLLRLLRGTQQALAIAFAAAGLFRYYVRGGNCHRHDHWKGGSIALETMRAIGAGDLCHQHSQRSAGRAETQRKVRPPAAAAFGISVCTGNLHAAEPWCGRVSAELGLRRRTYGKQPGRNRRTGDAALCRRKSGGISCGDAAAERHSGCPGSGGNEYCGGQQHRDRTSHSGL